MNKVLVTGYKGFIGSHLCQRLTQIGDTIVTSGSHNDKRLDVTDFGQVRSIEKGVDVIIHLAANTSVMDSLKEPHKTYHTNLLGTLNLIELARLREISKFIFISTYVYGQPKYLPIDESHSVCPMTPYNRSKLIGEQLCQAYSDEFGIDVVTLRPFLVYGPDHGSCSFIPSAIRQIKKNGKVLLSGEETRRDFLFIEDFVNLIVSILGKFPNKYNVYNVGCGKSYALKEVAKLLARLLNRKITVEYDSEMRPNDVTDIVADISKVSSVFNWNPVIGLEKGLELSI